VSGDVSGQGSNR